MLKIQSRVAIRRRYIALGAVFLLLALVLIVAAYRLWGGVPSAGPTALSDSQQAWLSEQGGLRIAGRWEEPPFAFFDEAGAYQGYEVDLAHSLGPVLGIGIEVLPMPQEEAVIAMDNGEIDAIMGLERDAQSSETYLFTEPYIKSSLSIFVRAESFDVTALQDLQGQQVAVQVDTEAETVLAGETDVSSVPVQSTDAGLELLIGEQVSALVADDIVGLRAAQVSGLDQKIKVVGLPIAVVNYGFAVQKTDDVLLSVLNSAIASVEAVGLKDQVDRAWFGTPPSEAKETASSSMLTVVLAVAVGGLGLGNVVYLLLKMRRRSEEHAGTLQELGDRYIKLVDGTGEAVFSVSVDGSFLEVNNRVESLTGYKKDELLRMYLDDLTAPAQRDAVRDCIEKTSRDGAGTLDDVSLLNRRGDEVPVQLSAQLVSQNGRRIIQCIARDVRERKRMHHQVLRRSEDLSAFGAIARMVSHVPDLEEMLEKVLAKVLELTQMESGVIYLSGKRDGEMIPVIKQGLSGDLARRMDWPEGSRKLVDEVARHGRVLVLPPSAQHGGPRASGIEGSGFGSGLGVPLTSIDGVNGVMSIHRREPRNYTDEDVALLTAIGSQIGVAIEKARLSHQLERSASEMASVTRFNKSILQNMTNGLVVIDQQGKVRLVNRVGERLLGRKEDDVMGGSVEEILGSGAEMVRDSLERALVYSGEEIVLRRRAAESIPLGISVSPIRDDGGALNGVVVMLSDLREAKAHEEESRRLDRLAFLGEISAAMAHEIRNPLAGMSAGIQHLSTKFEEGDETREALERILRAGERANRHIEDILLISRPPRLNLAPCDLSEVIDEVVSLWRERAVGQGVEIRKHYAVDLPRVKGDERRLHQAFSNLVVNAMESMPGGGVLSIRATGPGAGHEEGGAEGAALRPEDGRVEVEIADTGAGIMVEEMEKIFQPFYTTKPGGTGLGLPITQGIVKEHGGEIAVQSEEGAGTRFKVRLPLARAGE